MRLSLLANTLKSYFNPGHASEFQTALHVVDGRYLIHSIMSVLMVMVIQHADELKQIYADLLICYSAFEPTENSDCTVTL